MWWNCVARSASSNLRSEHNVDIVLPFTLSLYGSVKNMVLMPEAAATGRCQANASTMAFSYEIVEESGGKLEIVEESV